MKGAAEVALLAGVCGWALCLAALGGAVEEPSLEALLGRWEGKTEVLSLTLPMVVEFSQGPEDRLEARIDIQGAQKLPLTEVRFEEGQVHFELQAGPGLAVWEGRVEGDSIQGRFTQSGAAGEFSLDRSQEAAGEEGKEEAAGDETPKPFREEELTFQNGDITLAGTLTLPLTDGPYPAAVLITGSGPQNRDEELFGFRPFRIIAEYLSAQGVAVLRYDDRGVGGSSGNTSQSTSADFATDVQAALRLLSARDDIDGSRIGLIGHSEGALIAPMVAAADGSQVAFLVLLAGMAVSGEQILLAQGERILRSNGAPPEMIEENRQVQREIFQAARTGEWAEVEQNMRQAMREMLEKMPAEQRSQISDVDQYVDINVRNQLAFSRSPWFKYFLDVDPASILEQVRAPVLALYGDLDLQVPADINIRPLETALKKAGNEDVTTMTLLGANHLFQEARTGSPNEYPRLEKKFIGGFLEALSSWILEKVGKG